MSKLRGDAGSVFEMVQHFHAVSGVPIADTPAQLQPARVSARVDWLREEVAELEAATTLPEQVDAAVDVIYLALGALVEMGVDFEGPFRLVHESNLAKAWPDGTFHKTAVGKIIKPKGWQSPHDGLIGFLGAPTGKPGEGA